MLQPCRIDADARDVGGFAPWDSGVGDSGSVRLVGDIARYLGIELPCDRMNPLPCAAERDLLVERKDLLE
jgi:hypothetical protein